MNSSLDFSGVLVSILLPWLLGGVWVYWLLARSQRWNWWLVAGHGYIVGLFLTTMVLRGWSVAGLSQSYAGTAAVLCGLTLTGGVLGFRLRRTAPSRLTNTSLGRGELLFCGALLCLLAWRYFTILQEVLLLPLFPWDAWMNWAPKAVVWYHFRDLVDHVHPETWVGAPAESLSYTLGAYNAWEYPDGVPLIQLWSMLAVGGADLTPVYLPWVFVAIALGLSLYGHLRLGNVPAYLSTAAVYLLLSMPFVNVHSALAGYADIWVAAVFGTAVFAVIAWDETREWPYAVLALVLATFCVQLKVPGLIMAAIAVGLLIISLPGANKKWLAIYSAVGTLLVLIVFAVGLDFVIPGVGQIALSQEMIALPYIGEYPLDYHPVHGAMLTTNFLMINWHLLWYYTLGLALVIAMSRRHLFIENYICFMALVITSAFLIATYYFTERYEFAEDYTQVNRAFLYAIPLAVFFLFQVGSSVFHLHRRPLESHPKRLD